MRKRQQKSRLRPPRFALPAGGRGGGVRDVAHSQRLPKPVGCAEVRGASVAYCRQDSRAMRFLSEATSYELSHACLFVRDAGASPTAFPRWSVGTIRNPLPPAGEGFMLSFRIDRSALLSAKMCVTMSAPAWECSQGRSASRIDDVVEHLRNDIGRSKLETDSWI